MPRGSDAKLRRRNRKKAENEAVMDMFNQGDGSNSDDDDSPDDIPLPQANGGAESSGDDELDNLPKQKKKKKKAAQQMPVRAAAAPAGAGGGIKTTPLILLIMMVGTTLLPGLIYAGDYLSSFLAKNDVMGQIGFRMGIGAVPKKRVLSFYEKHAPEKLEDVPTILAKHYGDYPKLIKKLERKYQDYGYFVGWEEDEAPMRIAMEHLQATYDVWLQRYWNRYAPQALKTAARNVRYNLTFLFKKFKKAWKKHIWPVLEPFLGVPDGAAAQKRKDAAEARKLKNAGKKQGTTRRKNRDYRDDDEH